MVINKKIKRTFKENKMRFIGTLLLIALSVTLFVAFQLAIPSMKDTLDSFRTNENLHDTLLMTYKPLSNIDEIENKFGVKIEERVYYDDSLDSNTTLRVLSNPQNIDKHIVVKGKDLKNPQDILIDPKFAAANSYNVGDKIKIENEDYSIVGFFTVPEYTCLVKTEGSFILNHNAFGIGLVSKDAIKDKSNSIKYYTLKFDIEDKTNEEDLLKYVSSSNVVLKYIDKDNDSRATYIDGDIDSISKVSKILPIMILIITSAIVAIVLSRLLKIETTQIGVLYALGYNRKQLLKHYLVYSEVLSVIGALLGIVGGLALARPVCNLANIRYSLPMVEIKYSPWIFIAGFCLPLLLAMASSVYIILKSLNLSPLDLIRGISKKDKKKSTKKNMEVNLKRFSFGTKFKLRELLRNIPKVIILMFGICISSVLLLFGFCTTNSLDYITTESYNTIYKYDYMYSFKGFETEDRAGYKMNVSLFESDKYDKKPITVYGIDTNCDLIAFKDQDENEVNFKSVLISNNLAKKMQVNEGDKITITNKFTKQENSIVIDKIVTSYLEDFIYIPLEDFNTLLNMDSKTYNIMVSGEKLDIDNELLSSFDKKEDIVKGYSETIKPLKDLLMVITVFSSLIALITIIIITSILVEENKLTISLLKILGYKEKRISNLVLDGNIYIVVLGYVLAIPSCVLFVNELFKMITEKMNIFVSARLSMLNIIIGFIIIVGTFFISKASMRKNIMNTPMTDILKTRE